MKPLGDNELKEVLVRDYKRGAELGGSLPSTSDIERQVLADLELVDRTESHRATQPKAKPLRNEGYEDIEAATGTRVRRSKPKDRNDPVLDTPISKKAPKVQAAMARIKQILEPRGAMSMAKIAAASLEDVTVELQAPELAKEFLNVWIFYSMFRSVSSIRNPFYGQSDYDSALIFRRKIEDICDKSTAQFGPWWVR